MTDGQLEARITKLEGHAMALARLLEAQQDVSRNLTQAIAVLGHTIGETADDDHITLEELDFEDKLVIFQWTMEATSALKPFRANG